MTGSRAELANSGGDALLLGVGDDGDLLARWCAQPPHHAAHAHAAGPWRLRHFVVNIPRHNGEPLVPIAVEQVAVERRDVVGVL